MNMSIESQFQLIKQGAEAKIYKGVYLGISVIIKERFKKAYRHSDLNDHLTKDRTKAEARCIVRCKIAGVHSPAIYCVDLKKYRIYMEFIEHSISVKDFLVNTTRMEGTNSATHEKNNGCMGFVTQEIGKAIGKLHSNNIIHGDLTTSNMLLVNVYNVESRHLVLIDFGLSFTEPSVEDKSVDLYVLERALISTHGNMQLFLAILVAYAKENKDSFEILKKLEEVRARGRKRSMVG